MRRRVRSRTSGDGVTDGPQSVEIAVSDSGAEFLLTNLRTFLILFSLPKQWYGHGFVDLRTIIDAHNGRLWAENKQGGWGDVSLYATDRGRETLQNERRSNPLSTLWMMMSLFVLRFRVCCGRAGLL